MRNDKAQEIRIASARIDGPEGTLLIYCTYDNVLLSTHQESPRTRARRGRQACEHTNNRSIWGYLEEVAAPQQHQTE